MLSVALDLAPGAGGRLVSAPGGIECPADCSESYTTETYITLTAIAGPGSVFADWKNSIWCQGANVTCQLQMWPGGDGDRSATASFAVAP